MKDLYIKNIVFIIIINLIFSAIISVMFKFFLYPTSNIIITAAFLFTSLLFISIIMLAIIKNNNKKFFNRLKLIMGNIIDGQLDKIDMTDEGTDIISVKTNISRLKTMLTDLINKLELSVLDINGNASTLFMFSETMTMRINSEKDNINTINNNMSELKDISLSINDYTRDALNLSKANKEKINLSISSITNLIEAMKKIAKQSNSIVELAEFIETVADETNLLALNASIEASRAGSEGAGFTIVASEIRELAENSASAIKNISETVENIMLSVKNGEKYSKDAQSALNFITQGINDLTIKIEDINKKISNQSSITESVHNEIEDINGMIKENSSLLIEMMQSIQNLSQQSDILKDLLSNFSYETNDNDMSNNIFGVNMGEKVNK